MEAFNILFKLIKKKGSHNFDCLFIYLKTLIFKRSFLLFLLKQKIRIRIVTVLSKLTKGEVEMIKVKALKTKEYLRVT